MKNKNALQDQRTQAQAEPIVTPIVEAIKTSKATINRSPQSREDVRRIVLQLREMRFEDLRRNQYIQSVARLYHDDNLFNVFLALNKDGFYKPPIAKIAKYGLVESLIFYSQGGRNLDMLPMSMQTERFKNHLDGFDEFYADNLETIRWMLQPNNVKVVLSEDEDSEQEDLEQQDSEFQEYEEDEDSDFQVNDDDVLVTGEGLATDVAEAVDRLSTLYSSKKAGNTSLEVNNEAQDILKRLLKWGKINKTGYHELEKLF